MPRGPRHRAYDKCYLCEPMSLARGIKKHRFHAEKYERLHAVNVLRYGELNPNPFIRVNAILDMTRKVPIGFHSN